jgi:hypothetical protein
VTETAKKERPIHELKPARTGVAFTYCGVDPYRKGTRIANIGSVGAPTCKDCARLKGGG